MKKKAVSTEGLDRYEALAKALGADATRMFGMPVLKAGGKVFAGFDDGAMTFKLDAPDRERALALPGAAQFDPGMGRPMKEWVRVPAAAGEEWESLARSAQADVRTQK
jgi:hypothetical protein